jgi:hypothetical protein
MSALRGESGSLGGESDGTVSMSALRLRPLPCLGASDVSNSTSASGAQGCSVDFSFMLLIILA